METKCEVCGEPAVVFVNYFSDHIIRESLCVNCYLAGLSMQTLVVEVPDGKTSQV